MTTTIQCESCGWSIGHKSGCLRHVSTAQAVKVLRLDFSKEMPSWDDIVDAARKGMETLKEQIAVEAQLPWHQKMLIGPAKLGTLLEESHGDIDADKAVAEFIGTRKMGPEGNRHYVQVRAHHAAYELPQAVHCGDVLEVFVGVNPRDDSWRSFRYEIGGGRPVAIFNQQDAREVNTFWCVRWPS